MEAIYSDNDNDFISQPIYNEMDLDEDDSESKSETYYNKEFFKLDNIINIIQNNNILNHFLYIHLMEVK